MRKLVLTCSLVAITITSAWTQTLFTYGNNAVDKQEFLRIYQKNSINKAPDYSETALREYLELYSLFRMKVKEAEVMQIDTLQSIQSELNNYRKQLAKNYFTDEKVNDQLVREAYERMKQDVRVAHILIMSSPMAASADTVAPYKTIDSIYNAIKKGADFAEMAKKFSEDQGSKGSGGDIGYITVLQTVYEFENAAYNTPVGSISKPIRTRFGYHIVKVLDKRDAIGQVQVQQILLSTPKSSGNDVEAEAKKKIATIYASLKKGTPFNDLVKKYSDDKFSLPNDGILEPFGVGQMVPDFENAAIALKKTGDVSSKPIKTEYGYHIIKLVNRQPVQPYDSVKDNLTRRVKNDSRAEVAREIFFENVKKKNNYKNYPANIQAVTDRLNKVSDTGAKAGIFTLDDFSDMNKPVFELNGKKYLQNDMMAYAMSITKGRIMGPKERFMKDLYKHYVNIVVQDVEEHNLVDGNPEFRSLMQEYRDGIMLFELMNNKVWGRAGKDTTGLKIFYNDNTDKYKWQPGYRGAIYKFKDEASMKRGLAVLAKKGHTDEDVLKAVNNDTTPDGVTIERGYFEYANNKDFTAADIAKGKASSAKKNADGIYLVAYADDVFSAPTTKTLDEARGYVVADFQDYLEQKWNKELRKKYPVKLNDSVFNSMVK